MSRWGLLVEIAWWLRLAAGALRRWPGQMLVLAVLLGWIEWFRSPLILLGVGLLVVVFRCWAVLRPLSFHRWIASPLRGIRWRRRVRRHWRDVMIGCELARWPRPRRGQVQGETRPSVPRLARTVVAGPRVTALVQPLIGQTVDTFVSASDALRVAFGAAGLRVDAEGSNRVALTFTIADDLAVPFLASMPRPTTDLTQVPMGRSENGDPWMLPIGPHTLVAGMSGSGKGSVFWSFALGLANGVRGNVVQLHGVDLKGGMEVFIGERLFATRATDAAEAVALLERVVALMRARTRKYAGSVRMHTPSAAEPLHVVMIDELAALTAYCPERELQRRAEMAINLLCSQGRAPGFMVFACLQDPRKEVIPSRGLFTQTVALRLKDAVETAMVLGEGASAAGAGCHRIPRGQPGVAYVLPESGDLPLRVRSGFVSDDQIREVAEKFSAPDRVAIQPAVESLPSPRRPRSRTGVV